MNECTCESEEAEYSMEKGCVICRTCYKPLKIEVTPHSPSVEAEMAYMGYEDKEGKFHPVEESREVNGWGKDFEKVFLDSHKKHYPFDCLEAFDGLRDDIKDFIASEIELARREVLREVEKWADDNIADGNWNYERLLIFIKKLKTNSH